VPAGSLAKASSVGAKTVKGPGPFNVSTRSAALRAAARVLNEPAATAVSTMSEEPCVLPAVVFVLGLSVDELHAAREDTRQRELLAQGFISPAAADDARAALAAARQRVAAAAAALRVARLPAREDQRTAAGASASAAQQALRQGEWAARQKRQDAPVDAQVADTFFRPGEWVAPGQPVVSLLPAGATRARFFVPEAELGTLAIGQPVSVHCDGCGSPIAARIDFIATQAEYTPPVIYSNSQRARLVFRVEALPDTKDATRLKPGQPLDVRRPAGA